MLTPNQAGIRVRQLCALGLPGPMILPDLLRELHGVVPGHGNMFCWAGRNGHVSGGYMELPDTEAVLQDYTESFCNRREAEVMHSFRQTLHSEHRILSLEEMLHVPWRDFRRHDMYQRIIRPLGIRHALSITPRLPGRPGLGGLMLLRTQREPAFNSRERQRLSVLLPHLSHALGCSAEATPDTIEEAGDGYLILDPDLRVQHSNRRARSLFALLGMNLPGRPGEDASEILLHAVHLVARRLCATEAGHPDARAPSLRVNTQVGGILLRADRLEREKGPGGLILLTLRRFVPARLRAYRALRNARLSGRQLQVALALAENRSYAQISARSGIKPSSVITHARHLFDKLGVANREAFLLYVRSTANQEGADPAFSD